MAAGIACQLCVGRAVISGHCLFVSCTCTGVRVDPAGTGDQCGCGCVVGNDADAPVTRTHGGVCKAAYDGAEGGSCCGEVAESSIRSRASLLSEASGGGDACRIAWESLLCVLQCDTALVNVSATARVAVSKTGNDPTRQCMIGGDSNVTGGVPAHGVDIAGGPRVCSSECNEVARACKVSVGEVELDVRNYRHLFHGDFGTYVPATCDPNPGCLGSGVVQRVVGKLDAAPYPPPPSPSPPPPSPLPPASPPPPPSPPPPSLVVDDYENDTTGLAGMVLVFAMTTFNLLLQL